MAKAAHGHDDQWDGTVRIATRLEKALFDDLVRQAQANSRSVSAQIAHYCKVCLGKDTE